ncbi:hypothetical protein MNBD_GAMMA22-1108 [hydrothermal vent metagenome]|uniref:HDOD domain-containing protein n=1 Tax=hydrothermal vent metagenome TaxID=652676 RepID=A0A3B1AP86_9ZZZZ
MLHNRNLHHLIDDNIEQFSLPDIVVQLNSLMNDPNSTIEQLSNLISQDAALTIRLLKLVNSSYYNFSKDITTISQAINILGIRELSDFVTATKMINQFNSLDMELITPESFWRHNLACATAARTISKELNVKNSEQLFICGLIHDIGKLVLYIMQPKLCDFLIKKTVARRLISDNLELKTFGFTHQDVGAQLLKKWGLPEVLIATTQYHHQPQGALEHDDQFKIQVAVIHLANAIANLIEAPLSFDDTLPIHPSTWTTLNIDSNSLITLTQICETKYGQVSSVLIERKAA